MGKLARGRVAGLMVLAFGSAGLQGGTAFALDNDPPKYWAVTGVAANDVLNVRDVPDGDAKKIGSIPPNAHGIKHVGCMVPTPSMDRWMTMTPAEKANAKLEWCRIEYKGQQGWVAARFLKPDTAPSAGANAAAGANVGGGANAGGGASGTDTAPVFEGH